MNSSANDFTTHSEMTHILMNQGITQCVSNK
ncbi:GMP reductase domain protein, partial [Vibrio harveyi]